MILVKKDFHNGLYEFFKNINKKENLMRKASADYETHFK